MEDMGYQNTQALYDLNRTGRLAKKRGDNLTCYTLRNSQSPSCAP